MTDSFTSLHLNSVLVFIYIDSEIGSQDKPRIGLPTRLNQVSLTVTAYHDP